VVSQQADAIAKLGSKLVYLNDKTFGQASNYQDLSTLNEQIKAQNPDFNGFVVQTTAAQLKTMPVDWLQKSGIKFVELGIESYNDPVLKAMHKPATESLINQVVDKLRQNHIALIPNIIIGHPLETAETYQHTLDFLRANKDIISHANIYNLALYKDTELGKQVVTGADGDFNENVLEKSFHTNPEIHRQFAGDVFGLASEMLQGMPEAAQFQPKTPEEGVGHIDDIPESRDELFPLSMQYQPSKEPRAIRTAAVRDTETGIDYEAPSHAEAYSKVRDAGVPLTLPRLQPGFLTYEKEFLDGTQAHQRAQELGQISETPGRTQLASEDIRGGQFQAPKEEEERGPTYYSQLSRVIDSKFSGAQMPAAQLESILRNPQNGVKADEMKWSGMDDFLKGKQRVTKEEVLDFLKANQVQIREVVKGGEQLKGVTEEVPALETKFQSHQLPGGENYREVLFTLPVEHEPGNLLSFDKWLPEQPWYQAWKPKHNVQGMPGAAAYTEAKALYDDWYIREAQGREKQSFRSGHWDEPNVLAHTRLNDRDDSAGKPGLFAEEIQSDWHQKGLKKGYKPDPQEVARLKQLEMKDRPSLEDLKEGYPILAKEANPEAVPAGPLSTTWHELVFRRLVRMAAEQGKDWMGWTTGEQQAERYDLSKQVSEIGAVNNGDGTYALNAKTEQGLVTLGMDIPADKLADHIGKDLANKIVKNQGTRTAGEPEEFQRFTGTDLKVGGEGMRGFYDKILVDYANKFGKKFGAKVEERLLSSLSESKPNSTDPRKARKAMSNGDDVYGVNKDGKLEEILDVDDVPNYEQYFISPAGAEYKVPDLTATPKVHSLPITPEMKKSVMQEGVAQFQPAPEVADLLKNINETSPDEWLTWARSQRGGVSGAAFKVGMAIKSADDLNLLRSTHETFSQMSKDAMFVKDYDAAQVFATKAQVAREAYEAATGRTMDGTKDVSGTLSRIIPGYKAPMAAPSPEEMQAQPKKQDKRRLGVSALRMPDGVVVRSRPGEIHYHAMKKAEQLGYSPEDISAAEYGRINLDTDKFIPVAMMKPQWEGPLPGESQAQAPKTYIVRHGSTSMNAEDPAKDKIRGFLNVPLSQDGKKEVQATAEELKDSGITTILTSDLDRARQTADAIAKTTGAKVVDDPGLRPWNLGHTIEGKPTEKMLPVIKGYVEQPDKKPPGGETFNEFKDRFLGAFKAAQEGYSDENTAIVTHYRGTKLLDAWRDTGVDNDTINNAIFEQYDQDKKPGSYDVVDKTGAETSAQFQPGHRTLGATDDDSTVRGMDVTKWNSLTHEKRGIKGDLLWRFDHDTGTLFWWASPKDVSTDAAEATKDWLAKEGLSVKKVKYLESAPGVPAKDFIALDAEAHRTTRAYTQEDIDRMTGQLQPKKDDWKLKPAKGTLFSKAWITPEGTPIQLGGQWHHDYLNENPGVKQKYGIPEDSTDQESVRAAALKRGFARINYGVNNGVLTVEARKKDWESLMPAVQQFAKANASKMDHMEVNLFDNAVTHVIDSDASPLFRFSDKEKMNHLPLISAPSSTVETSAQASSAQFQPFQAPTFDKELENIRSGASGGQTFSPSGEVWSPTDKKADLVSLASVNLPLGELTREKVTDALAKFADILDDPNVVAGLYSFSKAGKPTVSVDLNAVVPKKYRENTLDFAKQNDQVAVWDVEHNKEVPAGGKGETKLQSPGEILDALNFLTKGKPVDVENIMRENRESGAPEELALPGIGGKRPLGTQQAANMTKADIAAYYPESVVPRARNDSIPSEITSSPLYKEAGSHEAAVDAFGRKLVEFSKEYRDHPSYQSGLRWYSDFVPKLKAIFKEDAPMMAELLAGTSPQQPPAPNYAMALDALEGFKKGRFNKQITKFEEGLDKLRDGSWKKWLDRELKAGKVKGAPETPTAETFVNHWVAKHDLLPRRSNGKLYSISSDAVLKILARRWLGETAGLKTQNFVKNLTGAGHEATIDLWADRTMRRLGYSGSKARWRILPKNATAVSDADFKFSQMAFRKAAEELGVHPSALQGALWFAEKQLWADNGWGRLDLGDYRKEIEKTGMLRKGIEQRTAAKKAEGKAREMEQPELMVEPRKLK